MQNTSRDDRILAGTRWLAALVIPFLLVAFGILYFFPQDTARLFAWKIQPGMSAMMLGAAYAGGIYFFSGVLLSKQWHRIKAGILPVTTFATLLGIATILHWDKFNHSSLAFFAWASLYFTTPFLVLAVWFRNRIYEPVEPEPGDPELPGWLRLFIGLVGVFTLTLSLLLFLSPTLMIGLWPWTLTPLTSRVMSAMFGLPGVVNLGIALDRRWSAARIILQSQGFSILLILIAAARAWKDFLQSNLQTWLFIGGLSGMLVGICVLTFWMETRMPSKAVNK
jgi:hypothetical protein